MVTNPWTGGQHPLFSVIIPAYQESRLIRRNLEQFTADLRCRSSLEIIVSDGGSTDDTLDVAEELADKVITNCSGRRQTISMGRNAGARHARGEFLLFINADTFIDDIGPFFDTMASIMSSGRFIGATCNVYTHRDDERLSDKLFHLIHNNYFWFLNIVGVGMGRGECQVIPKSAFDAIGGYNESLAAGEDFDLFVRVRRYGRIAFARDLSVRESPRRYRKFGYLRVSFLWFINGLSVLLFKRSVGKHWEPVR